MIDLNQMWVDIECPKCGYQDEIQLLDAKTERTVFCHNCKINIKLTDGEASVNNMIDSINSAFNEFDDLLKNL